MVGNQPVEGHRPRHGNCPRYCDRRIDGNPPSLVIFLWRVNTLGIVVFLGMMMMTALGMVTVLEMVTLHGMVTVLGILTTIEYKLTGTDRRPNLCIGRHA